ncbi:protein DpdF [Actinosynnema pretiosum]|uniref:DNA 3'-5' helicase n=1 Tax=Actinosynnema pretiosum TaxID=42197 RepID=A0A290Z0Z9_9PSEU|nr:protein DpdF [Actinosynnema pretiosum]ATE52696.1 DEAD/DEAH box helicase [Actinosynnema pretiosum]
MFDHWPALPEPDHGFTSAARRLADALRSLADEETGPGDVASLVRQILLGARARGSSTSLTVPLSPVLPTKQHWEAANCTTVLTGAHLKVWATPWMPVDAPDTVEQALADLDEVVLGKDASYTRSLENCPADPFWKSALGEAYAHYRSVGQRQVARSVVTAPPGSTTVVCLPTGHGKTETAFAAATLGTRRGLMLMVVPTVALAIDMERRFTKLVNDLADNKPAKRHYAYHAGLTDDVKDQIVADVRQGHQRVLFTSPEAVATKLSRPLEDAAATGSLRYLVLDEAHIVEQWGDNFRPEFQTISSQLRDWRRKAPPGTEPRVIAMSATLTGLQVETLASLFGTRENTRVIWASQVRVEPSYYVDSFDSEPTRHDAVLKAIRELPRPMVLYTSKVEDAEKWRDELVAAGFRRVVAVTGKSSGDERREVLEGWGGRTPDGDVPTRYDVVVGTSAFGLGIDLSDVRTVVHACLPETIDRFYQEVGRGGRDGQPSIAYLATTQKDHSIANDLNSVPIVRAGTAWSRWSAMFRRGSADEAMRFELDLESTPAHVPEGYSYNRMWNIRTLNLMVKANLVDFHALERPARHEPESDDEWQARLDAHFARIGNRVKVSLIDGQVNSRSHFEKRITEVRRDIVDGQRQALKRLRDALTGSECIGDVLADYYSIESHGRLYPTTPGCRGCPHCRKSEVPLPNGLYRVPLDPEPDVVDWPRGKSDPLSAFRNGGKTALLSLPWGDDQERSDLVPELISLLCRRGMTVIGGPGLGHDEAAAIQRGALPHPVIHDYDEALLMSSNNPVVWVVDEHTPWNPLLDARSESDEITYLIHPKSMLHPQRGQPFVELHSAVVSVKTAGRHF